MAQQKKPARVARLATLAAQTASQKAELLVELKKIPVIQTACTKAGVGRSTYYAWRKEDKIFAQSAKTALQMGKAFVSDMAISQLIKKIQEGNMTSVIFWLKNHHADYSDRVIHEHEHEHRFDFTQDEKDKMAAALRHIGLANILKMNSNFMSPDKQKQYERESVGKPTKEVRKKTLGERLAEEAEGSSKEA